MASKNWGESFAEAFTGSMDTAQKLAFEKWKQKETQSPENVFNSLLPMMYFYGDTATKKGIETYWKEKGFNVPNLPGTEMGIPATGNLDWLSTGEPSQQAPSNVMPSPYPQTGMPTLTPKSKYFTVTPSPTAKKEAENVMAAKQQTTEQGLFQKSFSRSWEELGKKYPDIGQVGWEGALLRLKVRSVDLPLDELPETKAFVAQLKPRANLQARTVEGGRVTDADRKIYADAYPNALMNPDATNIRLASDALLGMEARGGNIGKVMIQLLTSTIPIDKKIAYQALEGRIPNFNPNNYDVEVDDETNKIYVTPKRQ